VRLSRVLASFIAIFFGVVTLAGLLVDESVVFLSAPANFFLRLVVATVGITVLIGVINLLFVHLGRIFGRKRGMLYSLVLIASFVLVIVTYFARRDINVMLLEDVQVSIESALAGLLLFALVFGAYRMMHRRVTVWSMLFVMVLLIVLVGALPLPGVTFMTDISNWLFRIPVSAGARGIWLGIALATVVTGVRVLIGQDRSYRE
jgi:hypothetical protein